MTDTQRQIQMYGMTTEDIREQYVESITARIGGMPMVIASILSDCQEMLAMGAGAHSVEYVRQKMNIAKHLLFVTALTETA